MSNVSLKEKTGALDKAKLEAMVEKLKAEREKTLEKARENVKKNYPHADPGSVRYDDAGKRVQVEIKCVKCGAKRVLNTSDLHQVDKCVECAGKAQKEKRAAQREMRAAAMKLYKEKLQKESA